MPGLTLEAFPGAGYTPLPTPDQPSSYRGVCVSGAEAETLTSICRLSVNLAIWNRTLPRDVTTSLRLLTSAAPFTAVAEGAVESALDAVATQLPTPAPLDLLLDIQWLANVFAVIASTGGDVCIRLEAIDGPACHRWHADAIGLRMLCTYRGSGTEWLPIVGGSAAARGLDVHALPCAPVRIGSGDVAILKGEGHPGNAGFGCIHRSPPAGPGNRARLLLCIDEPGRIPLA